jgi:hypothetical protein
MDYRQPIEPAIIVLAVAGARPLKRVAAAIDAKTVHESELVVI